MNSTLTPRTRAKHFTIHLTEADIAALVDRNTERINHYAERYVSGECDNYTLRDYLEMVCGIMAGLAPIPEIKRQLRVAIDRRQREVTI